MRTDEAFEVIREIGEDMGENLLETMIYMHRNLFQFDIQQRDAYRVVMVEIRKLFENPHS